MLSNVSATVSPGQITNSNNPITPTDTKKVSRNGDLQRSINDFFITLFGFLKEDWD
jgi:hypothetical protein